MLQVEHQFIRLEPGGNMDISSETGSLLSTIAICGKATLPLSVASGAFSVERYDC